MAKLTLIGMEQFLNPEHSVFENLELPEGIDKDILINTILLRCNEFELLYPDPNFMTAAVTVWGKKHYWTFDKWIKVMNKEYDPLYNKDYHEEWTDTHEGSGMNSGTDSRSDDYTRTDNLKAETDITDTHSEKAYNNTSFVDTTKDVTDGEVKNTGTQKNAGTSDGTFGSESSDTYENNHEYHGYGNIGIMSSQQLFRDEVSTTSWSIYEAISDMFCSEFCIMIY